MSIYDLFISYNTKDITIVEKIVNKLKDRRRIIWFDHTHISAGSVLSTAILNGIKQSQGAIIFYSRNGIGRWQQMEIDVIIKKNLEENYIIIPIALDKPGESYMDARIKTFKFLRYYTTNLDILVNQILSSLSAGPNPDSPSMPEPSGCAPRLLETEWCLPVIKEEHPEFLVILQKIRELILEKESDADVLITCYGTPYKPEEPMSVDDADDSFFYDMFYYYNIHDPSYMFGPIIKGDYRKKITWEEEHKNYEFDKEIGPKRLLEGFPGRERVRTSYWYKLGSPGNYLWQEGSVNWDLKRIEYNFISGWLSIPVRRKGFKADKLKSPGFYKLLSDLEKEIEKVNENRMQKRKTRRSRAREYLKKVNNKPPNTYIRPSDITDFFNKITNCFECLTKYANVAFTVFAYVNKGEKQELHWLWSNGPTGVLYKTKCSKNTIILPARIIRDIGHKPLLIHNLKKHLTLLKRIENSDNIAVPTKHIKNSRSNLIVPIHSNSKGKELLGIIDIQREEDAQFNTDDIQFLYELCEDKIADFMVSIIERTTEMSPCEEDPGYKPFNRTGLKENFLSQYLQYYHNEMNFLLYWDTIEAMLTGKLFFPIQIGLWLNLLCNHSCSPCNSNPHCHFQHPHRFLKENVLSEISAFLENHPQTGLSLKGGGEPFLHPDLDQFLNKISSHQGFLELYTNGSRPSSHSEAMYFWHTFLAIKRQSAAVMFCQRGYDPESYKKQHGVDFIELKKLVCDITALRSPTVPVAIYTVLCTTEITNQDYMKKIIHLSRDLGADILFIIPDIIEISRFPKRIDHFIEWVNNLTTNSPVDNAFPICILDCGVEWEEGDECFIKYLAPVIRPDFYQDNQINLVPCSYEQFRPQQEFVINSYNVTGSFHFEEFWQNTRMIMQDNTGNMNSQNILPAHGCPRCPYGKLNHKISVIKRNPESLPLINQLVEYLNKQDTTEIDTIGKQIENILGETIINIAEAKQIFETASTHIFDCKPGINGPVMSNII